MKHLHKFNETIDYKSEIIGIFSDSIEYLKSQNLKITFKGYSNYVTFTINDISKWDDIDVKPYHIASFTTKYDIIYNTLQSKIEYLDHFDDIELEKINYYYQDKGYYKTTQNNALIHPNSVKLKVNTIELIFVFNT